MIIFREGDCRGRDECFSIGSYEDAGIGGIIHAREDNGFAIGSGSTSVQYHRRHERGRMLQEAQRIEVA